MSVLIFLVAIVLANLSVAYFGPASTPINAFLLVGLDLTLRDKLHEAWHGKRLVIKMFCLVIAGALITYLFNRNAGMIGVASVTAFTVALLVDSFTYQALWHRQRWEKMTYSNAGSALTDSILFPTIAFGTIMPEIITLQFLAKFIGGWMWIWVINRQWFTTRSN
jgi:uncharacterized PurR-regulated membrane protein YhhQ (DUF165 family)